MGVDAEGNYGDFRKKWTPTGSILISDTFETGIGTFGILGDLSYSRIRSRADGVQITNFQTRDNTQVPSRTAWRARLPQPVAEQQQHDDAAAGRIGVRHGIDGGADGFADLLPKAYAPLGGQYRTQEFDRKRDGIALAAQFETRDKSFLLTAQYLRSHTTNTTDEHTFEAAPDLSKYSTFPVGCVQNNDGPLYNGNGTVRAECPVGSSRITSTIRTDCSSGYITSPGTGYRTSRSGAPATTFLPTGGAQLQLARGQTYDRNLVSDYGLNAEIHRPSVGRSTSMRTIRGRTQQLQLSIFARPSPIRSWI